MSISLRLPARLACLAALLLASGCTYDLFDDPYDGSSGRLEVEDVLGAYRGERVFVAPGQTEAVPATVTVSRLSDGVDTILIRIQTGDLVDEYLGSYDGYGLSVSGEVPGSTSFNWYVDGDGFITGTSYGFPESERREYTGRLTADHFDLLIRSPGGAVRNDLRTSR